MARNNGTSHDGIGALRDSFPVSSATKAIAIASGVSAVEGKAVTLTGNNEVGLGADNDPFFGVLEKYEDDGLATVQWFGFKENVPAVSGSVPTFRTNTLVVDGSGAVKASGTVPTKGIVIESDNSANVNTITVLIG